MRWSEGVRLRCKECPALKIVHRSKVEQGFDPECLLFVTRPNHLCRTNTGALVRPGQRCFNSARVELMEGAG